MYTVAASMARRLHLLTRPRVALPVLALVVVSMLSLAARVAWLGGPCRSPCRAAADHLLIFDEDYYVNAARVIAGLPPPAGLPYASAPLGDDPNAEHPQLAKVVMAGSIELFGDGPFAWRLGSILLGSLSILGMFVLARAAGAGRWLAVGAAALMAGDNLLLVHGRIGTLDIYALTGMIWGVAAYLRGRPILAGLAIAVGACAKEVAPYALLVLVLVEALQALSPGSRRELRLRLSRLVTCVLTTVVAFLALLELLDLLAPPYDDSAGRLVTGGAFRHVQHILSYAAHQSSPHGPQGIASYPWQWLVDYKSITYLNINPSRPASGLARIHPAAHFLGVISPPILASGLLGLVVAALALARRRRAVQSADVAILGLAWFAGTFVPFELLSVIWSRTSYLYYMVIVMPGLYLAAADVISRLRGRWRVAGVWTLSVAVAVAIVIMYPFTPVP
jgi:predicted membrane-bound dolichyl-phosphate-mannose-protein mannosyltransferase